MYKKKRYLKEMGVKLKPDLSQFTTDQIQHIKFLYNENPSLWTASCLAMSFGIEIPVSRVNFIFYKLFSKLPRPGSIFTICNALQCRLI